MRCWRDPIEKLTHTENWYFCSEMVAMIYKELAIYPSTVNPKNALPRDIAYPEVDTDHMPRIVGKMTPITTPIHYRYGIRI